MDNKIGLRTVLVRPLSQRSLHAALKNMEEFEIDIFCAFDSVCSLPTITLMGMLSLLFPFFGILGIGKER